MCLFLQTVNTQDTFRAIFDHSPVGMAYVTPDGHYLEVNKRLCEITGYSREELVATSWQKLTHPADLPTSLDMLSKFVSNGLGSQTFEKRYIRKDGAVIWVKVSVSVMRGAEDQAPLYHVTTVDEITQYKRAQELLEKTEEKCSKAFRQTPAAILISSMKDSRYLELNEAFERLTGYSRQEALGKTSLDLNLWVDPAFRQQVIDTIATGNRVEGWEMLYRARDGRIFTGLTFVDKVDVGGEPCLISTVMDISDLKSLETELKELSGRLIEAQDLERRQMAEELTNSLGQSVAVVSFELAQLARMAQGELARGLNSASAKIRDVAAGIGTVSQRLHPSGLEFTGLPWAIESLCRQFTHLYELQVEFRHEGVPGGLPPEISLALYRIVQEGLSNVVHHSGTRQAWIELKMNTCCIRLNLWDEGVGIDNDSPREGLGLLTMRERCRRLNGWLVIHNKKGTRLEAHIPIPKTIPSDSPDTSD
ncbi:MAG TPA: PAS domain S-box protein [Terracidiphilus sp.]|nr:PAS domain S-box protein [Terracidiphilus sp.]